MLQCIIGNCFFNRQTGLSMVCPITTTNRNYPLHVLIAGCGETTGYVLVEQVKSIDFQSRNAGLAARAPEDLVNEVLAILQAFVRLIPHRLNAIKTID